jgi:hypothetical protein
MPKYLIAVPFKNHTFLVLDHHGEPWAPIKPIIQALGLDDALIQNKTKKIAVLGSKMLKIPGVDKIAEVLCVPVRKLLGWLMLFSHADFLSGLDDALYKSWLSLPNKNRPAIDGRVVLKIKAGQVEFAQPIPDDWLVAPLDGFHELSNRAGYRVTHENLHHLLYESKF